MFFVQEEDGIRDDLVTGVQTCALPISPLGAPVEPEVAITTAVPSGRSAPLPGAGARESSGRHRMAPSSVSTVAGVDRKSTRLNSSHQIISYAVFCLKKKTVLQSATMTP